MQLGARWRVGDPPHASVPTALHAAIAEQERQHPEATGWTLTWLEGRPRCELGGDDLHGHGAVVSLSASGEVRVVPRAAETSAHDAGIVEDDDDWLD